MNILKKIITAIRGGTREIGEAIVDSQGTRIFAQEIEDAKESLNQAKHDLTEVMAKEMQAGRKVDGIQAQITQNEQFVAEALGKNEEALALEIAGKVATLEAEKAEYVKAKSAYGEHIAKLKQLMETSERQLADYERQLTMVKTTENVQKATAAITDNFSSANSTLLSAKESLERIRQKQEDFDDRYLAAEQLEKETSGASLEEKMQQAGIGATVSGANAVLERIKQQQAGE
ncbi:MAG: phage shock protein A [Gammaproteobacteria bacterium]|nr:MAG: phage shock protein A [Gammaproteobacteria bacterium]